MVLNSRLFSNLSNIRYQINVPLTKNGQTKIALRNETYLNFSANVNIVLIKNQN